VCGGIGALNERKNSNQSKNTESEQKANTNASRTPATPTPIPEYAYLKNEADELLSVKKEDTIYSQGDVKDYGELIMQLDLIPKDNKNYKKSVKLKKVLEDRRADVAAEVIVLGKKPEGVDLKLAFNNYLRNRLNDYDSSEYVNWTQVSKVYVKSEPFWQCSLKLRAKNAFGAYVLQDVKVYLRGDKVVLMEGL